ncbi:MAG TPA: acetyl-CoA carboxylase biotin carboxyl carrier protein subunit [Chitinophagaceae bacterium]|nr:acetyl-CoA carboxylase biotin carboxyl carrier protein subunit [Chitinophagaceae bacterium]
MSEINKTFLVKANEFVFSFDQEEIDKADFIKKNPAEFNLIKDNRSVNAKLLESDIAGKNLKIEVDGETFELVIKDELDQRLDSMGFSSTSTKHIKEIKAPMPGLVLEVAVKEGQEVKEGERILILEAMKMENSIMIHTTAIIKRIAVTPGQAVDKGQVLVELE